MPVEIKFDTPLPGSPSPVICLMIELLVSAPRPLRSPASLKAVGGTVLEMNRSLSEDDFCVIKIHKTGDCRNWKLCGE